MFVERVSWTVPRDLRENSVNLLATLHHYMDSSGGLIRSLSGSELSCSESLVSITFWKGWEDLARFLASPKASLLTQSSAHNSQERLRPHHFEVVWQWPEEEVDTISGESFWAINDYYVDQGPEALLDNLRQLAPGLARSHDFSCAGLWLDKNNGSHVALATHWSGSTPPSASAFDWNNKSGPYRPAIKESQLSIFRVKVTDPFHLGVA